MDYNVFRKIIASCVEGKGDNIFFRVNTRKLCTKLKKFGIIPILYKNEFVSKAVEYDDIFLLAEYFKEDKLEWFDGERTFLPMLFVREEDMTDELQDLLYNLHQARVSGSKGEEIGCPYDKIKIVDNQCDCCCCCCHYNDNIDVKTILINIISKYPCYFVIIGKWVKEENISLNIRFRASSILINTDKDENDENNNEEDEKETK